MQDTKNVIIIGILLMIIGLAASEILKCVDVELNSDLMEELNSRADEYNKTSKVVIEDILKIELERDVLSEIKKTTAENYYAIITSNNITKITKANECLEKIR